MEKGAKIGISEEVKTTYNLLKFKRKLRLIELVIRDGQLEVVSTKDRKMTNSEGYKCFNEYHCRYIIWDADQGLFLFTWCPPLAPMNEKTLYASQRVKTIQKMFEGTVDVYCVRIDEVKRVLKDDDNAVDDEAPDLDDKEWLE